MEVTMTNFYAAEKKLTFADFLISRGEGDTYASAAYKHTLAAVTIIVQELTNLEEPAIRSPQLVAKAFKRFNEPKAAAYSKFYLDLMKLAGKPTIPANNVEEAIRKGRNFMDRVKDHKV